MSEFPYQIVSFLDTEPTLGEAVYVGENGWYPQIALKRRFKINGMSEDELFEKLQNFCAVTDGFTISIKHLVQPEQMPVRVLEVEPSQELIDFHLELVEFLGESITSRFPERDGENYYPHITAEYEGRMVIDETLYKDKQVAIEKIYLLKDEYDANSIAYKSFYLR